MQEIDFSNLPRLEEEPPQIGGGTVSRSSCLKSYFFLIPKPFSENSRTADSKNVRFEPVVLIHLLYMLPGLLSEAVVKEGV